MAAVKDHRSSKGAERIVTKQERIEELQNRYDRDRRTVDVIWSISLFAVGVFLLFTVIFNTTGSFGNAVHDICIGLFGAVAYAVPFFVFIFAVLLIAGRLQHIGVRTSVCGILILINVCLLNSYRFISSDPNRLAYGFNDIAGYYADAVNGKGGGCIGMEIGSLTVKFFGKPGLLIISAAVIVICIFLIANTPISRFFESLSKKIERKRILRELEAEERDNELREMASHSSSSGAGHISDAGRKSAVEDTIVMPAASSDSFFRKLWNGAAGNEAVNVLPPADKEPIPLADSGTGPELAEPERAKDDSVMELMRRDTLFGKLAMRFNGRNKGLTGKEDEEDYGYPGRSSRGMIPDAVPAADMPEGERHYGLDSTASVSSPGAYGLDAHKKNSAPRYGSQDITTAAQDDCSEETSSDPSSRRKVASKQNRTDVRQNSSKARNDAQISDDETDAAAAELAECFSNPNEDTGYRMPPADLLDMPAPEKHSSSSNLPDKKAELLERTLNDFGVDARVVNVTRGASVTRFEVQPATGVKVASITRLTDDIALNLRAKSIRMEAPIPGKAAVGIEIENEKPSPVLIRDLIESEEFAKADSKISFVVGKDISGRNIIADLKEMPHLLIAGATGSGKSVCINTIITSFLYKAKPSELKLIMIDPKVVELSNYNGIPHMLVPVVTDPKKASRALAVAVQEMDKRYEEFAKYNVKDIESYNKRMRSEGRYADCKPQVVIIIDELADLMMAAPSEVETSISRLAQKARAAGMHIIVATQRPSVDVVTGLIKANIPSRIAFSVASQFDSRTILDNAGAEKLLGKGDMLFSPVTANKPYRVQGPFISEKETERIIEFVKNEGGAPEIDDTFRSSIESADSSGHDCDSQDELTPDAVAFILKSRQASSSMLQRRFRIGYNRAARIIDEIEEMGIIGPADGSRPRQVLITEDEYYRNTDGSDAEQQSAEDMTVNSSDASAEESETVSAAAEDTTAPSDPVDYFNSLPEKVRKQLLDSDRRYDE